MDVDHLSFLLSQSLESITKKNVAISLCTLSSFYVIFKLWKGQQLRRKLPRFPGYYYPILGNYKYAIRAEDGVEFKLLKEQRELNSDAITISVPDANSYHIVITDANLAKECYVRNGVHTSARMFSLSENLGYFIEKQISPRYSIAGSTGQIWHDNRRRALGGLRELGVGKNRLEQLINTESDYLNESLHSQKGSRRKEVLSYLFATATTNVMCQLCFGMRFSYDDVEFKALYKNIRTVLDAAILTDLRTILPVTLRRAPLIYNQGIEDFFSAMLGIRDFIRKHVVSHQDMFKKNPESFEMNIEDCLLKTFVKHFGLEPNPNEEDIMVFVLLDMFIAGTDTTSTTLEWAIYFLRNHQDIQKLLKNEIAENISSQQIVKDDMAKLPLCHAFLLESLRFGCVLPATIPHVVTREFSAGGYTFPKGTTSEISLFCVSRDRKIFKNPDKFDINNFLSNGNVVNPDDFIPFGIGPRVCLGEKIARIEAFVFLANIIKNFTFSCLDNIDSTDDNNAILGIVRSPKDFIVNIGED